MIDRLDASLYEAYLHTAYTVATPKAEVIIRIGRPCPILDELLKESDAESWVFLSAFNPGSKRLSQADNEARHARLVEALGRQGWVFFPACGQPDRGDWPGETSVLIVGMSREVGRQIAGGFEQLAIVYGERGGKAELLAVGGYPEDG